MHFISVFFLAFLAFTQVLAAPKPEPSANKTRNELISHKASKIILAIDKMDHDITKVNKILNRLNSTHEARTMFQLVKLSKFSDHLKRIVQRLTWVCRLADPFSRAESDKIVNKLVNMAPHMQFAIAKLVALRPEFDRAILNSGSVSPIIAKKMNESGGMTEELTKELFAKLDPVYRGIGSLIINQLRDGSKKLIAEFRKSEGDHKVPNSREIRGMLGNKFKQRWNKFKASWKKWWRTIRHGRQYNDEVDEVRIMKVIPADYWHPKQDLVVVTKQDPHHESNDHKQKDEKHD